MDKRSSQIIAKLMLSPLLLRCTSLMCARMCMAFPFCFVGLLRLHECCISLISLFNKFGGVEIPMRFLLHRYLGDPTLNVFHVCFHIRICQFSLNRSLLCVSFRSLTLWPLKLDSLLRIFHPFCRNYLFNTTKEL